MRCGDAKFPQDSTKCIGRFVDIAENVEHAMMFRIITAFRKVLPRAAAHTAFEGGPCHNLRAEIDAGHDMEDGEEIDEDMDDTTIPQFRELFQLDLGRDLGRPAPDLT